jgi:hypothetical protein
MMQHAKKMYVVDQRSLDKLKDDNWKKPVEHMLDALKTKEDNSWQKPIEKRIKTKLSLQMKRILESDEDDDLKAKQYRQALNRFLNIRRRTKEVSVDATDKEVEPLKKSIKRQPVDASAKEPAKKRKTTKKSVEKSTPIRASLALYSARKSLRSKKHKAVWEPY